MQLPSDSSVAVPRIQWLILMRRGSEKLPHNKSPELHSSCQSIVVSYGSDVGVKIKICLSQQQPLFLKRPWNNNSMQRYSFLNEYSKRYGLWNVTWVPKNFNVILAVYCDHYFSASNCKPNQNKICCEGLLVCTSSVQWRLFLWIYSIILVLGLIRA